MVKIEVQSQSRQRPFSWDRRGDADLMGMVHSLKRLVN
ncbi:hypothetical protein X971_4890 (plasmid) [Agrobacterium tumefaciens LBA4213 (Ach5)]|nr:hypothetical protein X971_4890 [Agrobacterium tumefaciens LBA4213 (Ach5)]